MYENETLAVYLKNKWDSTRINQFIFYFSCVYKIKLMGNLDIDKGAINVYIVTQQKGRCKYSFYFQSKNITAITTP
jgi:hypothetical protein